MIQALVYKKEGDMRKGVVVLAVAVAMLATGSAKALDVGGAVKGAVKSAATDVAKGAVANELNKDLANYTCKFNPKTKQITGCDLTKLAQKVQAERVAIETAGKKLGKTYTDYNLYVKTSNYELYKAIESELQKYKVSAWDLFQDGNGPKDSATFYVKVE